ncbi:MAG: potassium channel family protein [Gammaproteobacteria bacterium]
MGIKRVVLFGYNNLSYAAAKRLNDDQYDVIVADLDEERLKRAQARGFQTAMMDFRSDDTLIDIGVGRDIDMIFCFFPDDAENVFLTISARSLDKKLPIVSIVNVPESAGKLMAAGANKIINPYEISGRKIYELIKKPVITDILDHTVFGRHDLNMAEVEIPKGSILENTLLSDLAMERRYDLILIGVVNKELGNDLHFAIGGEEHKLDAGDILVILGSSREIRAFKKDIAGDSE